MGFAKKLAKVAVFITSGTAVSAATVYYLKPGLIYKGLSRLSCCEAGLDLKTLTTAEGYKFHYAERGRPSQTKPTIVLVHGYAGHLDNWALTVKQLSADTHVVAVNLPCHGDTACNPETDLHILGLKDRLHQFLTTGDFNNKGALHLVGQSMGGAVVGCYAATHPENVQLLTMICPVLKSPTNSELITDSQSSGRCCVMEDSMEAFNETTTYCINRNYPINKQILKGIVEVRKPYFKHWVPLFQSMIDDVFLAEEDKCLGALMKQISVPTQIIWGEKDRIVHCSGAKLLEENLPDCRQVHVIEGAAHSISLFAYERLGQYLMDFNKTPLGDTSV